MDIFSKSPITSQMFWTAFFIFMINPTAGMIYGLVSIGASEVNEMSKGKYYLGFFLLAAWLGVVNMTKTPASDQGAYLGLFSYAHHDGFYKTVFMAWGDVSKEFLYGVYTWLMHYICFNNGPLFFFYTTIIIYMLHFVSAYKIMEKLGASKGTLLCGVLILAFFTQYFTLTNHLVRQMLAAGVIIYGISRRICCEKYWWAWVIGSVFIHTSVGMLAAMALIPQLYRKMKTKNILIFGGGFIAFVVVAASYSSLLASFTGGEENAINYGISRLASNDSDTDTNIPLSTILMVIVPLALGILSSLKREKDDDSPIYPLSFMAGGIIIFVLTLTRNPLIQYRFFYFTYSFVPIFLPLIFQDRSSLSSLFSKAVPIFFIIRFIVLFDHMGWDYGSMTEILIEPAPYHVFVSPILDHQALYHIQ